MEKRMKELRAVVGAIALAFLGSLLDKTTLFKIVSLVILTVLFLIIHISIVVLKKFNDQKRENDDLKEKIEKLTDNISKLESQIIQLEDNKKGLGESLADYRKENDQLIQFNQKMQQDYSNLNAFFKAIMLNSDDQTIKKAEKILDIDYKITHSYDGGRLNGEE